jgi:hypothetical protein
MEDEFATNARDEGWSGSEHLATNSFAAERSEHASKIFTKTACVLFRALFVFVREREFREAGEGGPPECFAKRKLTFRKCRNVAIHCIVDEGVVWVPRLDDEGSVGFEHLAEARDRCECVFFRGKVWCGEELFKRRDDDKVKGRDAMLERHRGSNENRWRRCVGEVPHDITLLRSSRCCDRIKSFEEAILKRASEDSFQSFGCNAFGDESEATTGRTGKWRLENFSAVAAAKLVRFRFGEDGKGRGALGAGEDESAICAAQRRRGSEAIDEDDRAKLFLR